jgi:hypothetical protein
MQAAVVQIIHHTDLVVVAVLAQLDKMEQLPKAATAALAVKVLSPECQHIMQVAAVAALMNRGATAAMVA